MVPYPVLVLQHDPREGLGRFGVVLERAGVRMRVVETWNGDRVPSTVSGHSHLVVLGGPLAAYDAPHVPHLADEVRLIREARATRTPILGVCLGAQLMAHALGGRAFRGPRPEVGWRPLALAPEARTDKLLRHLPPDLPVFQAHEDTYEPPPGATRLASSDAYAEQAFRLEGPVEAYGLQFHLEWDASIVEAWLGTQDRKALAALGVDPEALLRETRERERETGAVAERVFHAFLTQCGCHD